MLLCYIFFFSYLGDLCIVQYVPLPVQGTRTFCRQMLRFHFDDNKQKRGKRRERRQSDDSGVHDIK